MRMEEEDFRASLSAKVDVSVNMDRVFGKRELDFMLFFSSIIAFVKSAGQANYVAGSTFKDSFAQQLQQERGYAVKIMNWGYWGSVGVVAEESYSRAMRQMGVGSIEPEEGMGALQRLMESELEQMGVVKTIGGAESQVQFSEEMRFYGSAVEKAAWPNEDERERIEEMSRKARVKLEEGAGQGGEREELVAEMLAASLKSVGLLEEGVCGLADLQLRKTPTEFYEKWLSASVAYLQEQKWLGEDKKETRRVRELEEVWREWEERKPGWPRNGNQAE